MTWPQICPACGYKADATMNVEIGEDYTAQTGDVGICFGCGEKQTIDGAGGLILLSKEMETMLPFHIRQQLNQVQKVWYQKRTEAS